MTTRERYSTASVMLALCASATGCAPLHLGPTHGYTRPSQLVGEWVDVANTSPSDSTIWVLRENGYFAHARLHLVSDSNGTSQLQHRETRDASWYFDGSFGNAAHQSICFSKRLGRFGSACYAFTIDTLHEASTTITRLVIHGYDGDNDTTARVLTSRLRDISQRPNP